jgi:hypothetical protein
MSIVHSNVCVQIPPQRSWRSRLAVVRLSLVVAVAALVAYMLAWAGAGVDRLPTSWVTDHPIAVIGAWSLTVIAVVGPVVLLRFRTRGGVRSLPSAR